VRVKSTKNCDVKCQPRLALKERVLLSPIQAGGLAAVFKVLANDTRLRLLHALVRAEELCVTELAASIGMKPQAVSNQLQRLLDLGILAVRREGNNMHYRVIDRCVSGLLEQAWCLMDEANGQPGVLSRAQCCPEKNGAHS
jgi:ArsR family transcriptional regulator, lead/cadmium/zinc/bismuth-responsive transcriptional repressor